VVVSFSQWTYQQLTKKPEIPSLNLNDDLGEDFEEENNVYLLLERRGSA